VKGECQPAGTVVLTAKVGRGPGQLGVSATEGSAPMSFAVRDAREIWVLDQQNQRLQPFRDGDPLPPIRIDSTTYQDVIFLPDGRLVLMDRLVAKELVVLDVTGLVQHRVPLKGPGIPEPGLVGPMRNSVDGLWVDAGLGAVRVLDTQGNPDLKRPTLEGQPTPDGQWLQIVEERDKKLYFEKRERGSSKPPLTVTLALERRVTGAGHVDTDTAGNAFVIIDHFGSDGPPQHFFGVFGPDLALLRRTELVPEPGSFGETFRELLVTPEGDAYVFCFGKTDIKIRKY
jgi:hypothetical protein